MTETTNGTAVPDPASAGSLSKEAEVSSPRPSVAATSGSEGSPEPPAEKPRGSLVPPAAAAAAATMITEAAAAAAAKTPIRGTVAGRIKAPPSATASMQRQAFSHVDLSKLCWDMSAVPADGGDKSNGSGSNGTSSSDQPSAAGTSGTSSSASSAAESAGAKCSPAPTPVVERTFSRTGRETQRWATDPHTGQLIRLTTGCVPIMKDGRILLCSSSRKEAWILPKGGWESDETLEESAMRETFEEAGVLGTLGPVLDEIEYETRKAKKRRLERENLIKTMMEEQRRGSVTGATSNGGTGTSAGASSEDELKAEDTTSASGDSSKNMAAAGGAPTEDTNIPGNIDPKPPPNDGSMSPPAAPVASANGEAAKPVFRIQQLQQLQHAGLNGGGAGTGADDNASVASVASMASDASTSCTHARMRLFPLYVSEVRDEWPESGRARKVLDIDAAIAMMEHRPEFQRALIEVRDRRLHLTGPPAVPAPPVATDN